MLRKSDMEVFRDTVSYLLFGEIRITPIPSESSILELHLR